MNQPEMMTHGVANQTSERQHALHHTQTCVLLDVPCTRTKGANAEPGGLWISRPYWGFKSMLFIPLGREEELILSTLLLSHTSTVFIIICISGFISCNSFIGVFHCIHVCTVSEKKKHAPELHVYITI